MWKARSESDGVHVLGLAMVQVPAAAAPSCSPAAWSSPEGQDLALLDKADIWLAGEGSKASERGQERADSVLKRSSRGTTCQGAG